MMNVSAQRDGECLVEGSAAPCFERDSARNPFVPVPASSDVAVSRPSLIGGSAVIECAAHPKKRPVVNRAIVISASYILIVRKQGACHIRQTKEEVHKGTVYDYA